jgi:hypothetical protein
MNEQDERIQDCKRRFSEAASRLLSGDRSAATEADFALSELLALRAIQRAARPETEKR